MDEKEKNIYRSFKYSLTQISDRNLMRIVAVEFAHSLNRKQIIENDDVEAFIEYLLDGI